MKKFLLALIAIVAGLFNPLANAQSILQTAYSNGSTYHLLSPSSWDDAEAAAQALNGHLVTIETAIENDFISSVFIKTALAEAKDYSDVGLVGLWIGLNDAENEGVLKWSSGSSAAYRNWDPGQPENSWVDEDYIAIVANGPAAGKWHDFISDRRLRDLAFGVVEVSAVPEPSTYALMLAGVGAIAGVARARRRASC